MREKMLATSVPRFEEQKNTKICKKPWITLRNWSSKMLNSSTKSSWTLPIRLSAFFGLMVLQGMPTLSHTAIWFLLMLPT